MRKYFIFILVFAAVAFHWVTHPHFLTYNDAAKYALTAQSLAQGKGFTTPFIYPEYLRFIGNYTGTWHSYWPPLYPALLSVVFRAFGANDGSVILLSFLCFLASIFLLYILAKKLLGEDLAAVAILFYATTQEMLWYSTSGLSEPLFMCLTLGAAIVALSKDFQLKYFVIGILCSLAVLTRSIGLIYLPFYAILLFPFSPPGPGRVRNWIRRAVQFLGGFLVVSVIIRRCIFSPGSEQVHFHNMIFNPFLYNTKLYPAAFIMRTMDNINMSKIHAYIPVVLAKIIPDLNTIFRNLLTFHSNMNLWNWIHTLMPWFLSVLCVIGFFLKSTDEKMKRFRLAVGILLIIHICFLAVTITVAQLRYFHPLVPFLIIVAVYALFFLARRLAGNDRKANSYTLIAALVLIVAFQLPGMAKDFYYKQGQMKRNPRGYYRTLGEALGRNSRPGDIVVTNLQGWGSWYGGRRTVFYPAYPKDLEKLDRTVHADAMIIFEALFEDNISKAHWAPLVDRPADLGPFRYVKTVTIPLNARESIRAAVYRKGTGDNR